MAARWCLLVGLIVVAAQASAYFQPVPFPSFHALNSNVQQSRRPTRSADRSLRIINGNEASTHQFPHQAGIYVDMTTFCGGALIHPRWILTTATCAGSNPRAKYTVFLGAHHINYPAEKHRVAVATTQSYIHDDFNSKTFKDDVGLIMLPREVKQNEYVKVINLPPQSYTSKTFEGDSFQLSGWGYLSDSSSTISSTLQYIDVKGTDKTTCINTYSYEIYSENILCCVGANKQSPCQGDTGGALVEVSADGTMTHVAIASFTPGRGCSTGKPAGFTKTASYLDWINEYLNMES